MKTIAPYFVPPSSDAEIVHIYNHPIEFEKIEAKCGVTFTDQQKLNIHQILLIYADCVRIDAASPVAKPVMATFKKLKRSTETLSALLRDIRLDPNWEALRRAVVKQGFGTPKQYELSDSLNMLEKALQGAEASLLSRPTGGRGPKNLTNFNEVIWNLAHIFVEAGGIASAAFAPEARMPDGNVGGRNTPFIRFVNCLIELLPQEFHLAFSSLGERLHTSLDAKPSDWWPAGKIHKG